MAPFKANFPHILRTQLSRDNVSVKIKVLPAAILNMLLLMLSDIRLGSFSR